MLFLFSFFLTGITALISSLIVLSYFIEVRESWSVAIGRSMSEDEKWAKTKRLYVVTFWGLYVMLIGTHSTTFVFDVLFGVWMSKKWNVVSEIKDLRISATFQVAMWSTVALAESVFNWLNYLDYENFGRLRLILCFVNWVLKALESHSWRCLKRELKEKEKAEKEKEKATEEEKSVTMESISIAENSESMGSQSVKIDGEFNSKQEKSVKVGGEFNSKQENPKLRRRVRSMEFY